MTQSEPNTNPKPLPSGSGCPQHAPPKDGPIGSVVDPKQGPTQSGPLDSK